MPAAGMPNSRHGCACSLPLQAFLRLLAVLCRYGGPAVRQAIVGTPELTALEVRCASLLLSLGTCCHSHASGLLQTLFLLLSRRVALSVKEHAYVVLSQLVSPLVEHAVSGWSCANRCVCVQRLAITAAPACMMLPVASQDVASAVFHGVEAYRILPSVPGEISGLLAEMKTVEEGQSRSYGSTVAFIGLLRSLIAANATCRSLSATPKLITPSPYLECVQLRCVGFASTALIPLSLYCET